MRHCKGHKKQILTSEIKIVNKLFFIYAKNYKQEDDFNQSRTTLLNNLIRQQRLHLKMNAHV